MTSTLDVRQISVEYLSQGQPSPILHDVSCTLPHAQRTAVIGESGSGKSTFAFAITGLLHRSASIRVAGESVFQGRDLLSLDDESLRGLRRKAIRYVFQEPSESFNPLLRLGTSIRAALYDGWDTGRICSLLERVGLAEPLRVLRSYPHELSIGMLQRAAIAVAIAPEPSLLIADEPTSALDEPLKWQILDLLEDLRSSMQCTSLVVSHDPMLLGECADQVIVFFAGRIVEINPNQPLRAEALHPYTRMLAGVDARSRLLPPAPVGCAFHPRCPLAKDRCRTELPDLEQTPNGTWVRCFYWKSTTSGS